MSSETIYIPYFYIIRHIPTGKKYAGIRYAKGCNPIEFMQPDGYQTSSSIVHEMIKQDGLDAFAIETIVTDFCGLSPGDYEIQFLCENDCAKSNDWLNQHNGTGMLFHTPEFKMIMLEKYGVENPQQIPEIRAQTIQTTLDRYGVEFYSQTDEFAQRMAKQREEILEKTKRTCVLKYGVENYSQTTEFGEKVKQTNLDKRGVEHHTQTEQFQADRRDRSMNKWGVDHIMKSVEHRSNNGCFLNDELRLLSCIKGGQVQGKINAENGHLKNIAVNYWNSVKNGEIIRDKKICVTNGHKNLYINADDPIPNGFVRGMFRPTDKIPSKWYTDGVTNIRIRPNDIVPNGFTEGMTAQHNATSNSTAATYWCNDGIKNLRLKNGTPLPDGFSLGRIKWK